jgi:hypothetical protein
MSAGPGSQPAAAAVSVRLTGDRDSCVRLLMTLAEHPDFEVVRGPRGPYACDSGPGVRWYLTVRPAGNPPETLRGAARSRRAIRRPAATPSSRRHHP